MKRLRDLGLGISVLPGVLKVAGKPSLKGIEYFVPDGTDALWPVPPLPSVEGKNSDSVFAEYVLGVNGDLDAALSDLTTRYNTALEAGIAEGKIEALVLPGFDPLKLQSTK